MVMAIADLRPNKSTFALMSWWNNCDIKDTRHYCWLLTDFPRVVDTIDEKNVTSVIFRRTDKIEMPIIIIIIIYLL